MFQHSLWLRLQQLLAANQALLFLIALAILGRLLPHPDNITPLTAIGLFAGAYLDKRLFLIVPITAALISDLLGPGFYNLTIMLFVYIGFGLSALLSRALLFGNGKLSRLPATVLLSALCFYLVSNLGAWWVYYEHSLSGLISCYVNGLPYLGRSLAGDLSYALAFFGMYECVLLSQYRRSLRA